MYPYAHFPIPKFHKTSYCLYGLATRIHSLIGNGYKSLLGGILFRNHTDLPFFTRRGVPDHKIHTWSVAVYQTVGAVVNMRRMKNHHPHWFFLSVCEIHGHNIWTSCFAYKYTGYRIPVYCVFIEAILWEFYTVFVYLTAFVFEEIKRPFDAFLTCKVGCLNGIFEIDALLF